MTCESCKEAEQAARDKRAAELYQWHTDSDMARALGKLPPKYPNEPKEAESEAENS